MSHFIDSITLIKGQEKQDYLYLIFDTLQTKVDLDLFIFGLKLYYIKDLLLSESKIHDLALISMNETINPLSLEYDKISIYRPYSTRVNGALLALLFFGKLERGETNFMSKDSNEFLESLSQSAIELIKHGVEPNQIFMLLFTESVNQSIISDSGGDYEDRIFSVLTQIGISESSIRKIHDHADASTEFDFFFEISGRTYGIGAKRTLRERYKQFIKTAQMSKIDVMIEITLGLDLNEEKAKTIVNHGVYIFVSDEVYVSRKFLQDMDGVFSVKNLSIHTLQNLD